MWVVDGSETEVVEFLCFLMSLVLDFKSNCDAKESCSITNTDSSGDFFIGFTAFHW